MTPPTLTDSQRARIIALSNTAREYVDSLPERTDTSDSYIVGGAVRDAVLGEPANDQDFLVVGETVDSMLDRGFTDINASSFGVLHDSNHEEWALARTETKTGDGYKGITVDTTDVTLREDLRRRDLTMNAMTISLTGTVPDGFTDDEYVTLNTDNGPVTLIDPFNGRRDIENGTIRHVSDAFSEDPIRILRAARYAARFTQQPDAPEYMLDELPDTVGFTIHGSTKTLMREVAPELNRMSRDRIGEEIMKAMKQAENPDRFWDVLRDTGALAVIAPKLDRASIIPAGPEQYHREGDTYTHTMKVLQQMHALCENRDITGTDRVRRFMMAIVHDLGKVTVADEVGGLWSDDPPRRFGGHAQTGVTDAERLATRLGLPAHISEAMQDGAEHHMNIHDMPDWRPEELIEFIDTHDPAPEADTPYMGTTDELIDLAQADHHGRYQNLDVFTNDDEYITVEDAPENTARPVFDRDTFAECIEITREAITTINGYEVLRTGLCNEHETTALSENDLAEQLHSCDACRTPGPWVGDQITTRRSELITNA